MDFPGKKILQPMEEWIEFEHLWELRIFNKGPILFTGERFQAQWKKDYPIEITTYYRRGDFVANDTILMELKGKLGSLLRIRDESLTLYGHLLMLSTTLYRLKETVKRYNPSASFIVRNLPAVKPLDDWYFEAIEDASCICWPSHITDGIIHQEIWKEYGGIEKTIEQYKRLWNPSFKILLECDKLADGITAIKSGADGVIIRDLKSEMAGEIVKALRERYKKIYIEYCGDVHLQNIDHFASLGLDALSVYRIDFPKTGFTADLIYSLTPMADSIEPDQS